MLTVLAGGDVKSRQICGVLGGFLIFYGFQRQLRIVIETRDCILAELAFLCGRRLEGELRRQLCVCMWEQGGELTLGISGLVNEIDGVSKYSTTATAAEIGLDQKLLRLSSSA